MSTAAGHSAAQALQARQVPSTSSNSLSPTRESGTAPATTACSRLARARVVCRSLREAAAGGHMAPTSFLHRPAPKQRSTASSNPPSRA